MVSKTTALMFAWFASNDIWAVYGVMAEPPVSCVECTTVPSTSVPSSAHSLKASGELHRTDTTPVGPKLTSAALTETATPPAPIAAPTDGLSNGAKIGIGVGIGIFGTILAAVAILSTCYLRRRRREKAMLNAIEEVERGAKESQERIVLESRVSIVFDDGASAAEVEDNGRNGLSLPRREY